MLTTMYSALQVALGVALATSIAACSPARSFHDGPDDGGPGSDTGEDGDATSEAPGDTGPESDAPDALPDAPPDASPDGPPDGPPDASPDAPDAPDALPDTTADVVPDAACTFGAVGCVGLEAFACDASGNWQLVDTCVAVCVAGACLDDCPLPWGGSIPHGQSTVAYQHASELSPELCSSHMETRTCNGGTLSGSYTSPSCVQTYRDCSLPGYGFLSHGQQVTTYAAPTVPCGSSCSQTLITCDDGSLSGGSAYYGSCSVNPCTCTFGYGLGSTTLQPGTSCQASLQNVNTTSGCSGGVQYYASYNCTYTCYSNGTVARSAGGPCEIGNGACGGSVSSGSPTTCP